MKKWSFAHMCAYLSLALSVTMFVLWCCNVGGFTVVSLDSFVGVIVALLAIVVTISIGWQIYNTIEIKNRIEKLDELEEKYNKQDNKMQQIQNRSLHLIYASMGEFSLETNQFLSAFHYYMKSLASSMSLETPSNIDRLLESMANTTAQIKNGAIWKYMDGIKDSNNKICLSKHYDVIKIRYEEIYNDFISKVVVE